MKSNHIYYYTLLLLFFWTACDKGDPYDDIVEILVKEEMILTGSTTNSQPHNLIGANAINKQGTIEKAPAVFSGMFPLKKGNDLQFKYQYGSYSATYGVTSQDQDGDKITGRFDENKSEGINIPDDGYYAIIVDKSTQTFSLTKIESYQLISVTAQSACDLIVYNLEPSGNQSFEATNLEIKAGNYILGFNYEFFEEIGGRIVLTGFGGTSFENLQSSRTIEISPEIEGIYDAELLNTDGILSLELTKTGNIEHPVVGTAPFTWSLIGKSITDWGTDTDLEYQGLINGKTHAWIAKCIDIQASNGDLSIAFKFRKNNTWTEERMGYGYNSNNIPVVVTGDTDHFDKNENDENNFLPKINGNYTIQLLFDTEANQYEIKLKHNF